MYYTEKELNLIQFGRRASTMIIYLENKNYRAVCSGKKGGGGFNFKVGTKLHRVSTLLPPFLYSLHSPIPPNSHPSSPHPPTPLMQASFPCRQTSSRQGSTAEPAALPSLNPHCSLLMKIKLIILQILFIRTEEIYSEHGVMRPNLAARSGAGLDEIEAASSVCMGRPPPLCKLHTCLHSARPPTIPAISSTIKSDVSKPLINLHL